MKKIAFIFILLSLISCSTSADISSQNLLNGKWSWVSSSGGFIGKTITPKSENKSVVIQFSKSVIKRYENGKLVSENTFTIDNQASIYGGERKMIILEDNSRKQSFEIKDNKLFLNDECNDCYQSEYVRVK